MRETAAYRVAVAVAVVIMAAAIAYGYEGLRADEAVPHQGSGDPIVVATSTLVGAPIVATTTDPVVLSGGGFIIQVRGGDNPCRYLYTSNRVGTFVKQEIILEFIAGTHDTEGLAATGEMYLYGDTGPHLFEIEDAGGGLILTVAVGRGATVREAVVFPDAGLYRLYDRFYGQATHVSEITARASDQPGSVVVTDWCPAKDSAP